MKQHKAYKFRIYPNKEQVSIIEQTFGCTRFLWNQALGYKKDLYASTGKTYSKYDSIKDIAEIKKIDEYAWLKDVDSIALQQSLIDLDTAYTRFFKMHKGFPKFKSKRGSKNSFRTMNINSHLRVDFDRKVIKLPKLAWVKFKDNRIFDATIKSATVSKNASGEYYVSLLAEYEFNPMLPTEIQEDKVFSADMSAKRFMVSSEMEFENQKFYRSKERILKIRQRKLSKKERTSNNRAAARLKVARLHRDITNARRGYQKNLASYLVKKYDALCFEDLNISGMQQFSGGLSKTVSSDFSWSEFIGFLEWKCTDKNKHFVKVSRWFPSSKACNVCGTINEDLTLSDRTFKCECGNVDDRDMNAAKNIKTAGISILKEQRSINLSKKPTGLMPESYACGNTMTKVTRSAQESMSFRA